MVWVYAIILKNHSRSYQVHIIAGGFLLIALGNPPSPVIFSWGCFVSIRVFYTTLRISSGHAHIITGGIPGTRENPPSPVSYGQIAVSSKWAKNDIAPTDVRTHSSTTVVLNLFHSATKETGLITDNCDLIYR